MPAGGIHLCVGKRVLEKLNIVGGMDFYVGCVSADSWRNSSSTKVGTHFLNSDVYCYDVFFRKYFNCINNNFVFGYFVHLVTDSYWYGNDFVTSNILEDEYDDLKRLCCSLIRYYGIPRLFLPNHLCNPISELDSSGIIFTIDYLNSVNYVDGMVMNFDIDEVMCLIDKTADFVVSEFVRLSDMVGVVL